ncbi:NnrS family protein [Pseudocolwellia sp. HL-MZ7]|uniref:NnrS family protein n=1 Tax=Pseudocolwellia sp. HL-MZ7 TaxID=3400627 RepID=UPI003CEC22D4
MTKNLLNIQEPDNSKPTNSSSVAKKTIFEHVIFDLPFRSYFLLAPAFAIICLTLWLAFLNGVFSFNTTGLTPVVWHLHEMIFGFSATIAVAFILTASQTWTGSRSLHGKALALLILVWLAVRIALIINTEYSVLTALVLQAIWWIAVIYIYTKQVISAQNKRNYLFIAILFLMALMNTLVLVTDISGNTHIALHLSRSMILIFVLLMSLIGGRVIPFFTVRGANTEAITTPNWLNISLIIVSLLSIVVFILSGFFDLPIMPAIFMITASILHFIRLLHWRTLNTLSVPLLWSLHTSYLFISLGLFMLGLSYYNIGISFSDALHLLTIGAMSLMILAMMSRVSLGHTNRALKVKNIISLSFIIMLIAALIRSFAPYLPKELFQALHLNPTLFSWSLSAALWIVAMLIFLKTYWPILTTVKKHQD